jgi:hypothetical protein
MSIQALQADHEVVPVRDSCRVDEVAIELAELLHQLNYPLPDSLTNQSRGFTPQLSDAVHRLRQELRSQEQLKVDNQKAKLALSEIKEHREEMKGAKEQLLIQVAAFRSEEESREKENREEILRCREGKAQISKTELDIQRQLAQLALEQRREKTETERLAGLTRRQ